MEALMAVNIACLTIYDMIKSIDKHAKINSVKLTSKSGGKSEIGKETKTLDVKKAEKIILRKVKPLKGKEKIDIKDSFGRVLRSNLNSKRNQPEIDLSAMDGYAVRKETYQVAKNLN